MDASASALAMIRKWEKCRLRAYQDQGGVWTIGYGHTLNVKQWDVISDRTAEDFLLADVSSVALSLTKALRYPITQNQFDALVSLAFNVGAGSVARSRLLSDLNSGDTDAAAKEFDNGWDTVDCVFNQGLKTRRLDEQKLFRGETV